MRCLAAFLILVLTPSIVAGDEGHRLAVPQPPLGILRGILAGWNGDVHGGELNLVLDNGRPYTCTFDGRSYVELGRMRSVITRLNPGDSLEVVTDRLTQSSRCFARMIYVVHNDVQKFRQERPGGFALERATEHISPRGNVTYSGVVLKREGDTFLMKTRQDGVRQLRLRPDTRFVLDGNLVDAGMLEPNARIFVRAGFSSEDELEVYQVVRGEILGFRK